MTKKFQRFLLDLGSDLESTSDADWLVLRGRLRTYEAYQDLLSATLHYEQEARRSLQLRPRRLIKKLLALASLSFLRHYFGFDVPAAVAGLLNDCGSPERLSTVVSLLVALGNSDRPIDSWDLASPEIGDLSDPTLRRVIKCGHALVHRHEIAKQISLFGYQLELRQGGKGKVYYLVPPSLEFERALRLGYVRGEITSGQSPTTDERVSLPMASLRDMASLFADRFRDRVAEPRDQGTPFRRVRVNIPLIPDLYRQLATSGFHEDIAWQAHLAQDFLVPLRSQSHPPAALTESMALNDFLHIWRLLQFLVLVDIAAVRTCASDLPMLLNSIVRVAKERDILDLITSIGVDLNQAREFLQLVCADVRRLGFLDLQYRPFIRIAPAARAEARTPLPEVVFLPALVATANVFRNVQMANQLRLAKLPGVFVEVVADILRTRFQHVAVNRRVQMKGRNTDIDVAVLEGNCLYLFECKHSVFPSEPHEVRDVWEDIEKGVGQLRVVADVLRDPGRLQDYLAGWFPGHRRRDTKSLNVRQCVVCSHRIFSGLEHEGIPIRDFSSLSRLVQDGVLGMGVGEEDGEIVMRRVRVVDEAGFSRADLDEYLGNESKYFNGYYRFMRPISRFLALDGIIIARDTFVYEVELDEWLAFMQASGAQRMPDERRKRSSPAPLDLPAPGLS